MDLKWTLYYTIVSTGTQKVFGTEHHLKENWFTHISLMHKE